MNDKEAKHQGVGSDPLASTQTIKLSLSHTPLSEKRMAFLAKLPFFLNSSLKLQRIVHIALEHIQEELVADAAIVYVLDDESKPLTYWALRSNPRERLEGTTLIKDNLTIQTVIENSFPVILDQNSVWSDSLDALFKSMQIEFRNMLCMPLTAKGRQCVGAIQIINGSEGDKFNSEDIAFVEQFSHQVALAIDNARLLAEAQMKTDQLQALDSKKSEMISLIAHEFRTPLNIIQTASELVSKPSANNDPEQMLGLLKNGVSRLTRLVGQIRNLSLVQEQNSGAEMANIELSELCQDAVDQLSAVAAERSLKLKFKGVDEKVIVAADKSLLSIVLHNLLSNAIRFTPDGGRILLHLTANDEMAKVTVIDNGIGISEQDLPLIFEKFYEVSDILAHSSGEYQFKSGGLGLGLAAVRHILDSHNSKIEVKSELEKGSSFSFVLPRIVS